MIILYSTNCPKCEILKEKLKKKKVEFEECHDIKEMEKLGITVVPVLKVNNEYLDFKKANDYINKRNDGN